MTKKRNALGRGLSALLEDNDSLLPKEKRKEIKEKSAINEIPVEQIEANPFQPRTHFDETALNELAESIKVHGIIQPVTVRQLSDKKYQLISGERRFQASQQAGLDSIPAYIRKANDQQMLEMALIENIQRENLDAIEIALSYQRLISECSLKQEELGGRVGKERSTVTNYLRLLKLPPDIQLAIRDKKLSMGHARALVNIDNADTQLAIFRKVMQDELSVRKTEALVRDWKKPDKPGPAAKADRQAHPYEQEYKNIERKLSSHFGTKIRLKTDGKDKGEIHIPFVSVEDLNRLLEILDL